MERIRDFIILHYHLNGRDGPFWQRCRDMTIPDTLAERLALFAEAAHAYQAADDLFRVDSWVQVLLGQGLQPGGYHQLARMMPPEELRKALDRIRDEVAAAVQPMPRHADFLKSYCPAGEA